MTSFDTLIEALVYWNKKGFLVKFHLEKSGVLNTLTKKTHGYSEAKIVETSKVEPNIDLPHSIMIYAIVLKNNEKGVFIDDSDNPLSQFFYFQMIKKIVFQDL